MAQNSWSKDKGGCLLSSNLFNIFLGRIRSGCFGRTAITNLRFADGVDALAEEELELEAQTTQLMTNSANEIQRKI